MQATGTLAPGSRSRIGRAQRAAGTWLAGAGYTVVTIGVGLVATPILLRLLGAERLGAFRAVGEWMGYLLLADLGLGSATVVLLVRARRQGMEPTAAVARLALRMMSILGMIAALAGLALAWIIPELVKASPGLADELRGAAMICAAGLLLMPAVVFRMVLETGQRGYLVNGALLAQSLIITALSLVLAWRGWGVAGLALATLGGTVVFTGLVTCGARVHLGRSLLRVRPAHVPMRELASLCWPLAAAGAGNRLNLMTDAVVVGLVLGSAPVAALFLTQRLILLGAMHVNSIVNASWAALAELRHAQPPELFESRVAELARLVVGLGITITGTVSALNGHFVHVWVGSDFYGGHVVSALTAVATTVAGFTALFTFILDSNGDTRRRLPISLCGAAINFMLSLLLVRSIGLAGVVLATVVGYLIGDAWYCPRLVCRLYGVRPAAIVAAAAAGAVRGLPWAAMTWLVATLVPPVQSWASLIAAGAAAGAGAVAWSWLAVLTASERASWRKRFGVIFEDIRS